LGSGARETVRGIDYTDGTNPDSHDVCWCRGRWNQGAIKNIGGLPMGKRIGLQPYVDINQVNADIDTYLLHASISITEKKNNQWTHKHDEEFHVA
jgi:hypothetical protein